jgi:hypothetical protein
LVYGPCRAGRRSSGRLDAKTDSAAAPRPPYFSPARAAPQRSDIRIVVLLAADCLEGVLCHERRPCDGAQLCGRSPLMVGGTLYTSTSLSQVAAINAATGETKWVSTPKSTRMVSAFPPTLDG